MVLMEKREILVPKVTQGLMVHPVNLDKLARPVYREHQVTKGNQDSEDLQGKRALKAREDPRAHLENKGHGEPSETEAHKVRNNAKYHSLCLSTPDWPKLETYPL